MADRYPRAKVELAVHRALMPWMMSILEAVGSQENYDRLLASVVDQVEEELAKTRS